MRRPACVVLVLFAVLAAGCGGGSKAGAAAGAEPAGATIAPASAIAFVSVNTDESSAQWKNADALLRKFPIRAKLLQTIERALSDSGVDFNSDVRPALGSELDIVVLRNGSAAPQVVGLTQPADAQKFNALLDKSSPPTAHTEIDGWTVFSDNRAALTAFNTATDQRKLADLDSFKQATAQLPAEANITAYLNGASAISAAKSAIPRAAKVPSFEFEWLGASVSTQSDSVKIFGALKSPQSTFTAFMPTLLSRVPSGALVVASFRGGDQLSQQLTQSPATQQQLGQLERALGVGLDQLTSLVAGEGVLYVRAGVLIPEVTIVLDQSDPAAAATTTNKLAARAAALLNGRVSDAVIPGVSGVKKIQSLLPVTIYYGVVDGVLVISDSTVAFNGLPSTSVTDDPVFEKASDAAGRPEQSAGFLYVNIKDSIPLLEELSQTSGTGFPPEVSQNLAALESFLAYATVDNGVTTFSAVLQAR
jgi:hypothetical protein